MFKIGDKLTKENYTQGAIWCNENGCLINPETLIIETYPESTVKEKAQAEIADLKDKLNATDYTVIKLAEGVADISEYQNILNQRQQWRGRINELEAVIEENITDNNSGLSSF